MEAPLKLFLSTFAVLATFVVACTVRAASPVAVFLILGVPILIFGMLCVVLIRSRHSTLHTPRLFWAVCAVFTLLLWILFFGSVVAGPRQLPDNSDPETTFPITLLQNPVLISGAYANLCSDLLHTSVAMKVESACTIIYSVLLLAVVAVSLRRLWLTYRQTQSGHSN